MHNGRNGSFVTIPELITMVVTFLFAAGFLVLAVTVFLHPEIVGSFFGKIINGFAQAVK